MQAKGLQEGWHLQKGQIPGQAQSEVKHLQVGKFLAVSQAFDVQSAVGPADRLQRH